MRFYLVDLGWGNFEALRPLPHTIQCITDADDFKTFDLPDVEITEETKMIAFALDDEKSVKAKMSHIVLIKK